MNPIFMILLVLLVLFTFGMLPVMPWYGDWGYYPSGGAFLFVIILLLAILFGGGNRRGHI